jgi:hypothetical protein
MWRYWRSGICIMGKAGLMVLGLASLNNSLAGLIPKSTCIIAGTLHDSIVLVVITEYHSINQHFNNQ